MDFAVKLKENEKNDIYHDPARELKKICRTWKWDLHQLKWVLLVKSPKDYKRHRMT